MLSASTAKDHSFRQKMKNIGIIAKKRIDTFDLITAVVQDLVDRGCTVFIDRNLGLVDDRCRAVALEKLAGQVDFIIVFGGDGTLLSVARLENIERIPVLAVNLGSLGFLTEISAGEITAVLEQVFAGSYAIDRRMMLEAMLIQQGNEQGPIFQALNDIVVNKGALARMMDLDTHVNGSYLNRFKADGLIICTPTGSTGYSLSAGGPIVYPSLNLFSITPICPHTLTNRPLIISDDSIISVELMSESEDVFITVDGQVGMRMERHDRVVVRKSKKTLSLIKSPFRSYFEILKQKLKWGER
jgi:NAD+ kinase